MHRSQFAKIESHPLRHVLRGVVSDPRDLPTRSDLRAQIVEACPPGTEPEVIDALQTKAEEAARQAAADPGSRFDLRGSMDRLTLHVVETWEAAERIVPAEDVEPVDVGATLEAMTNPAERNLKAIESRLIDRGMGGQA